MGLFGPSSASLRQDAVDRGAVLSRWVPTYVDLGMLDGLDNVRMAYTFAVASASDLLFYECERDLYSRRDVADPFPYARAYNGRIPIESVTRVLAGRVRDDVVTASRRGALWKDLFWNKTVGAVLGVSSRSVTMAAVLVVETSDAAAGHTPHVAFGIPHQGDVEGDVGGEGLGFIGELLPGALSTAFELGSLAHEFRETSSRDDAAGVNLEGAARGLLSLMGRKVSVVDAPADALSYLRARSLSI